MTGKPEKPAGDDAGFRGDAIMPAAPYKGRAGGRKGESGESGGVENGIKSAETQLNEFKTGIRGG